jgi:hypothetical protein
MVKKFMFYLIVVCLVLLAPILTYGQVIKPGDSLTKVSKQYNFTRGMV